MRMSFVALFAFAPLAPVAPPSTTTVAIDLSVQYQTILGWEGPTAIHSYVPQKLRGPIIEELVNGLGLTRARIHPPAGNRSTYRSWEWTNDNGDPDTLNSASLQTVEADTELAEYILPFRQKVEANGEPFTTYVSPSFFNSGSTGAAPAWMIGSPGEYSEFAVSFLEHLKNNYNLVATHYAILNEAGNSNAFTAAVVAQMIKTLGPKLEALGFPTKIQFPECIDPDTSWSYIQALQNDPQIWPYVGVLSYHLYGGTGSRPSIRNFGAQNALPTAMSEFMGLKLSHLYDDLELGGVSYWGFYGLGDYLQMNSSRTGYSLGAEFWKFRQVIRYVRPGSVRIKATSGSTQIKPLAFVKNGNVTAVLWNTGTDATVDVTGLPAGTYGLSRTVGNGPYQELGIQNVAGTHSVTVPANSVVTLYPHLSGNQPPTGVVYGATPSYVTLPSSSATLSASADDPEKDPLSFSWAITQQPSGASAQLSNPNAANCTVSGLTVAGDYFLTLTVSDSVGSVSRQLWLPVFAGNQAPVLTDVHNRNPVMVTLWTTATTLRAFAWDIEGDPITYQWSVVSQPAGAAANLTAPTSTSCWVGQLTKAGEYVFKIQAQDPQHTVSEILKVQVYPANAAPVIASASASPAAITLPISGTTLTATTSDPEGDAVTHWWSVVSAPTGAQPIFASPGQPSTGVANLGVAGTYTFRLTAIDRTLTSTKDVSVTANPGLPPPTASVSASDGQGSETGPDVGSFTVTRAGDLGSALTVRFSIGGSAKNGVDYSNLASSVTIPGGLASATVTVIPVDDSETEGDESVSIAILPDPTYLVGSPSTASITIADDDAPPPSPEGNKSGSCGALGIEVLLLLMLRRRGYGAGTVITSAASSQLRNFPSPVVSRSAR